MKRLYSLLIIYAVVLFLYYPFLTTYFSQDDFFMFKVSLTDGSLTEFIKLFGIYPYDERGIAFYRPIFREALHNIYYSTFGLNHIPFKILLLGIHFINIFLVYTLIKKILKKEALALFVAFFFGVSATNVSTLNYLAGGIESSGAMLFALLTFIFYIKFIQNGKIRYKLISLTTFILALSSHEIIMAIPFVLTAYVFLFSPKQSRFLSVLRLWPYFIILSIFLYIDIFKIGFSSSEQQYQAVFNPKTILHSISWYTAWSFGIPEMLIDFVLPGLKLNPNLMRYWGNYYSVIFESAAISSIIIIYFLIFLFLKNKEFLKNKFLLFSLFWFIIGLAPVIFFPSHKSSHYLIFILPAFWSIIGLVAFNFYRQFKKTHPKLAVTSVIVLITSLFILASSSIKLGEKTYWASERGRLAEKLIKEVTTIYPSLPKGALIYFTNDPSYPYLTKEWGGTSKQASLILNGPDAFQLLYKDFTLKVFYQDLGGIPPDLSKEQVYSIVARIE